MRKPKDTGKPVNTPQIHTLDHEEISQAWLERIEVYGTESVDTQTLFDMLNIIEGELQDRHCLG